MAFIIATASVLVGFLLGYFVRAFSEAAVVCTDEGETGVDELA